MVENILRRDPNTIIRKIIDWEEKSKSHVDSEGTRKRTNKQGIVCEAKDERTGVQSCLFLMEPSTEDIDSKLLT